MKIFWYFIFDLKNQVYVTMRLDTEKTIQISRPFQKKLNNMNFFNIWKLKIMQHYATLYLII
jgi:hypothetical protein